jgi:hypothetical protein
VEKGDKKPKNTADLRLLLADSQNRLQDGELKKDKRNIFLFFNNNISLGIPCLRLENCECREAGAGRKPVVSLLSTLYSLLTTHYLPGGCNE